MISLAAEGGYQVFTLNGEAWFWLIFSAVTAVLALLVGLYLMRGVLAADEGTPKMREVALADCGHMMHHDQPDKLAEVLEAFLQ